MEVPYINNSWILECMPDSTEPLKLIKIDYIKEKSFYSASLGYEVQQSEIEKLCNFLRKENIDCIYMSTMNPPKEKTFRLNVNSEKFVDDFYEIYDDLDIKWLGWLLFDDQRNVLMFTDSDYYHVWVGSKEFVQSVLPEPITIEKVFENFKEYMRCHHLDSSLFYNYLLKNYV
ncbi:hypothetical protein [Tolypothrix sp. VBCCA 56010]|uniref:hypothetical protein n=1 Tax=Tolypothrix sp. VBCCA 56010 TaxID=3137731 RepID=UPI003D7D2014